MITPCNVVCIPVEHLEMHKRMCNDSKTQGMKKNLSTQYVMYTYMVHYKKVNVFFTFLLPHHRKWNETTDTILTTFLKLNNVEENHDFNLIFHIVFQTMCKNSSIQRKPHSIKHTFQLSKYQNFLVIRKLFVVLFWNVI